MKFDEILPLLRQGNPIRRKSWHPDSDSIVAGIPFYNCVECDNDFSVEDVLADDWVSNAKTE